MVDIRNSFPPSTWQRLPFNDERSVVTAAGHGTLESLIPLADRCGSSGVREGQRVVVRMNYVPAWRAHVDGRDVPLLALAGQLALAAPAAGDHVVPLQYPRRRWLMAPAGAVLLAGAAAVSRL